jgi:hypothetical protein
MKMNKMQMAALDTELNNRVAQLMTEWKQRNPAPKEPNYASYVFTDLRDGTGRKLQQLADALASALLRDCCSSREAVVRAVNQLPALAEAKKQHEEERTAHDKRYQEYLSDVKKRGEALLRELLFTEDGSDILKQIRNLK